MPRGGRGEKNAYAANDDDAVAADDDNDDDGRKREATMVAAPTIAGAEARRRAADKRRPGESLLFSSLEMNSEFRDRRARREGRQGGTNDFYVPKGM